MAMTSSRRSTQASATWAGDAPWPHGHRAQGAVAQQPALFHGGVGHDRDGEFRATEEQVVLRTPAGKVVEHWSVSGRTPPRDFQVAAVDLPGHGARSAQPWSLDAATEIIATAVDSLDRGPALIVGHSLGGYASLEFARRCPERLRRLYPPQVVEARTRSAESMCGDVSVFPESAPRLVPVLPLRVRAVSVIPVTDPAIVNRAGESRA